MGFFKRHPSVLGDQRRQSREYQAYLASLAYHINKMKKRPSIHIDSRELPEAKKDQIDGIKLTGAIFDEYSEHD